MSKSKNVMVTKNEMVSKDEAVYSVYDIVEVLIEWVKNNKNDEIKVSEFEDLLEERVEAY